MTALRYIITDIGPNDAYYSSKKDWIGRRFTSVQDLQVWEDNGWYYGDVNIVSRKFPNLAGLTAFHEMHFRALSPRKAK